MGRSFGEGNGYLLQPSCLENSKDRGAWQSPWGCKESDMTERLTCYHRKGSVTFLKSTKYYYEMHFKYYQTCMVFQLSNICTIPFNFTTPSYKVNTINMCTNNTQTFVYKLLMISVYKLLLICNKILGQIHHTLSLLNAKKLYNAFYFSSP